MSPKHHSTRKRKSSNRRLTIISVALVIIIIASAAFILNSQNSPKIVDEPVGLKTLATHYMQIMQNLNSTSTKNTIKTQLNLNDNQTDLFSWQQTKMSFTNDLSGWKEDPTKILNSGKGICVQWSIVYVSACLALDHPSRLVAAVDTSTWNYIHTWAEDYYNGKWVHVDPSDKVWDNPSRYQSWDWGTAIGSTVRIYAFEENAYYDVTNQYMSN
jgi:hypothetical protein